MKEYLFDCGIDVLSTFVCAALYYGSMKQEGDGAKSFRTSIDEFAGLAEQFDDLTMLCLEYRRGKQI